MDLANEVLKMAGALATVVALLLGGLFILRRFMGEFQPNGGGSMIRMLGGLRLGQGKSLMLVEVAGEVLVLGATARELTLLTQVADLERVEQLRTLSSHPFGKFGIWSSGFRGRAADRPLGIQEKSEKP